MMQKRNSASSFERIAFPAGRDAFCGETRYLHFLWKNESRFRNMHLLLHANIKVPHSTEHLLFRRWLFVISK